jgi:AAT family amino acid transporter
MTAPTVRPPTEPAQNKRSSWMVFGLANVAVATALALALWYLLVDPEWSPLRSYPEPYTALLFWGIIAVVGLGFNQEFAAFARLRQPVKGFAIVAVAAAFAVVMTYGLAHLWGSIDASFAADREGDLGYFTGALWVLFAFVVYVMSVVNWNHWPSSLTGLTQPWLGAAQIVVLIVPTTALYLIFGLPSLATWTQAGSALMDTNTAIGVFYSIVVSIVITGLLAENWPWRAAGSPTRVALAATVGNAVLGIVLYFGLQALAHLVLGPNDVAELGTTMPIFSAQIGVCWVLWMILWANCFGNTPTAGAAIRNVVVRIFITFVLGLATFVVYYFFAASTVLHEPAITSRMSGNALGWMDWWVLWTLVYVLCFESLGLSKLRPQDDLSSDVEDGHPHDDTVSHS